MATVKTSKILKCKFLRVWNNPNGKDLFYHELTMENGDIGNVGTVDKYPEKIDENRTISYTLDGNKLKLEAVETVASQSQGSGGSAASSKKGKSGGGGGGGGGRAKSQADYLGFSYSYAKDLVIAGKTTKKDMDNLKKMAEEIYAHVGELFRKGSLADQVKENPLGPYPEE